MKCDLFFHSYLIKLELHYLPKNCKRQRKFNFNLKAHRFCVVYKRFDCLKKPIQKIFNNLEDIYYFQIFELIFDYYCNTVRMIFFFGIHIKKLNKEHLPFYLIIFLNLNQILVIKIIGHISSQL